MEKQHYELTFTQLLEIILMISDSREEDLAKLEEYKRQKDLIPNDIRDMVEEDIKDVTKEDSYMSLFELRELKRAEFYKELGYTYIPIMDFFPEIRFF